MFITLARHKIQLAALTAAVFLLAAAAAWSGGGTDAPVLSYGLAGQVIVVDPGHGGIDPGALGRVTKVPEKVITLAIAKKLAAQLSQAGAMVVLTRSGDDDLSDAGFQGTLLERKRQDLSRRVAMAHRMKADAYLSIHVNADPSPRWHGAQTFYHYNSPRSREMAECIQDEMVRILGNNNRKAKGGVFFVIEKTAMPAVTVEVGFLSNPGDERLLSDELYQSRVAYAVFSGLVKYVSREE